MSYKLSCHKLVRRMLYQGFQFCRLQNSYVQTGYLVRQLGLLPSLETYNIAVDACEMGHNMIFHSSVWATQRCLLQHPQYQTVFVPERYIVSFQGHTQFRWTRARCCHTCHLLPFRPIPCSRYLLPEPVQRVKNSPKSISEGGRIWQVCIYYSMI